MYWRIVTTEIQNTRRYPKIRLGVSPLQFHLQSFQSFYQFKLDKIKVDS